MSDNIDSWFQTEQEVLQEIKQILSRHGLDKVWEMNPQLDQLIYRPKEAVVKKFGELAKAKLAPILRHFPSRAGIYPAEEIVTLVNAIFSSEYHGQTKFRGEVDEEGHVFSVDQKERLVKVP